MTAGDIRLLRDETTMRRAVAVIPVLADGRVRLRRLAFFRLWVKPGRHCHAAYRVTLDTDGGAVETFLAAALVRDAEHGAALLREVDALPPARAPWSAGAASAFVESPCALVQLFPWDHRLPTLAQALDAPGVGSALGIAVRAAAPVGYWPGIRCQLRLETADGPLFGKVFPDMAGAEVAAQLGRLAEALADADEIAVPAVRAWVPSLRLLVTAPLTGSALLDELSQSATGAMMGGVAIALARLHATHLEPSTRRFGPTDDLAVVQPWVAFTSAVFPELRDQLARALARLEAARPPDREALVPVHRDFYDKQVLVAGPRVGLLDLDTLCHGDAEIDVGNFCAHLLLRGLQWHDAPEAFAELGAIFVGRYREHRPDYDPERVGWYRASALLRLACLYALRPRWQSLAPRLAEESGHALA